MNKNKEEGGNKLKKVEITNRDKKVLENLIGRNGFKTILNELRFYAFARINNNINEAWEIYYKEIGSILHKREKI